MLSFPKPLTHKLRRGFSWRRWRVYLKKRIRQGYRRAKGSSLPIAETAIAATVAYWFAGICFTHADSVPFFAPIACWICMGFTRDRSPRKVLEMGSGVAIGLAFGDFFGSYFGIGIWQIFAILLVAPIVARFLDRGDLFTIQAAINSLVILMFAATNSGAIFDRLGDALIGAGVAFVFTVFLPRNVSNRPTRYLKSSFGELAEVMIRLSQGIGWGDQELLADSQMELHSLHQTWSGGYLTIRTADEVTYLNPSLRRERTRVLQLKREYLLVERIQTTLQAILRESVNSVAEFGALPKAGEALTIAAEAVNVMRISLDDMEHITKGRELALIFAAQCSAVEVNFGQKSDNWHAPALFSLYRNLAIDLLQLSGFTLKEARAKLPGNEDLHYALDLDPELGDESDRMWTSE